MKSRRHTQSLSLGIPDISVIQTLSDIGKKISALVLSIVSAISDRIGGGRNSFSLPQLNRRKFSSFQIRRYLPLTILIIVVLLIVGTAMAAGQMLLNTNKSVDARIELRAALATVPVGKNLSIPVLDSKGAQVTSIAYTIETAELRDEIIVQSRRMVAVKGRLFLILNIKLVNEFDKELEIKAGDYVRLSLNGNEKELLAPEIHNDPVRVQAISTKTTRVGFPIYDTDKNIALFVGPIAGEKEKVPLELKVQ